MANKFILYLDECGDQNLASFDPQFPIFTLCGIVVSEEQDKVLTERINVLKKEIWNNINIIFQERKENHEKSICNYHERNDARMLHAGNGICR